jgi:DNA polymerase delta subunit 1
VAIAAVIANGRQHRNGRRHLVAHEAVGEWSRMAPFRIMSIDIECLGRKGCFPEAEKDAVIQIASVVSRLGTPQPILRHIATLNSCSAIPGSQVESFDREEDLLLRCAPVPLLSLHPLHTSGSASVTRAQSLHAVGSAAKRRWQCCATPLAVLRMTAARGWQCRGDARRPSEALCRWQQLMAAVDADVLIGYNILNFDFPYLVTRAQTLKLARFMHWGRIRGSALRMRDAQFSSKAYGTHAYKDISIEGRVQFDLLTAIQRDHKLSSYSLNAVSAHFLGASSSRLHMPPGGHT